jgi:hypothetical protein
MVNACPPGGQVLHFFKPNNIIPKLKFSCWPCSTGGIKIFYSQMTIVNSIKNIIMIGELKRTAEEVVVVYFKVLSQDSCGMTKENLRTARVI